MKPLRIVFMGTPQFAVPSLDILYKNGFDIAAVVTAPDKPSGRGLRIQESAIKKYAREKGLRVLQPERLRSKEFINNLKELNADLNVVVAFRMLPEMVWNLPPLGTINVHASLLPQYRGAAPINWAIINGETITGATTFRLQHQIDTGNILGQQEVPIEPQDDAGSLHDKLMHVGAGLLLNTIQSIASGEMQEQPQVLPDDDTIRHAPKIYHTDAQIDWQKGIKEIHNLIRGLSPYPAAWTLLSDKRIKIFSCSADEENLTISPGDFLTDYKTYLKFAASDGFVWIETLQPEGKRIMNTAEFLRGWRN